MAAIPGSVRVAGFIAPSDTSDTYAVTDEAYNRGGYRSVATLIARDAITPDRRTEGMLVRVNGTNDVYVLSGGVANANWVLLSLGASTPQNYSHIQSVPATTWVIPHNLNRYPSITIFDSTSSTVLADIQHISLNTAQITFSGDVSGQAYCI